MSWTTLCEVTIAPRLGRAMHSRLAWYRNESGCCEGLTSAFVHAKLYSQRSKVDVKTVLNIYLIFNAIQPRNQLNSHVSYRTTLSPDHHLRTAPYSSTYHSRCFIHHETAQTRRLPSSPASAVRLWGRRVRGSTHVKAAALRLVIFLEAATATAARQVQR